MDGTPRALKPIAEEVLSYVARERELIETKYFQGTSLTTKLLRKGRLDELRRIELCAKVALNVANFTELYGLQNLEQLIEKLNEETADEEHKQDDNKAEPLSHPFLFEGLDAKSQHTS